MKKALILTTLISSMVVAETSNTYINMNQVLLTHSENGTVNDFQPTAFQWTLGHIVKDFHYLLIGVEGSLMLGVRNDVKSSTQSSQSGAFTNATTTLDKLYNVNIKAILPIIHDLSATTYLGVSRAKMLSTATNYTSRNVWDNSFSYGVGLEYQLLSKVSVHADYMKYFKNLDAIEFGIGFKF
ncbi:MAG: Unknown protein [uncultured Sulfurovum sp.]|uniref:Outer membrane protein beta-barrel domain-containing protein n=1 Tax=uncultured Sulfurovum sp. TaxID=269237 RepID=A0A6S6T1A3_9BACT|nr:MAG: Unknown protein [uncultured Sulfurovum sp.]